MRICFWLSKCRINSLCIESKKIGSNNGRQIVWYNWDLKIASHCKCRNINTLNISKNCDWFHASSKSPMLNEIDAKGLHAERYDG
jgi:hypothetical protein